MGEPDFTKPVDVCAFFFNEIHACGCSELDLMIYEVKRVLEWAASDIMTRPDYTKLYHSGGVFYIVAGLLNSAGLLEHGSSIRCSWITEKGRTLLDALNKFSAYEIEFPDGTAYDGCYYDKDSK